MRSSLAYGAFALLLTGCGPPQFRPAPAAVVPRSGAPRAGGPSRFAAVPAGTHVRLYVANATTSEISAYDERQNLVRTFNAGLDEPCCMIVGPEQHLHALNLKSRLVTNYTPGENTLFRTFGKGLSTPFDEQAIAIDDAATIYILNLTGPRSSEILEYAVHAGRNDPPKTTVSFLDNFRLRSFAVNRKGNLFAEAEAAGGKGQMNVYDPNSTDVKYSFPLDERFPTMKVDPDGALYLVDDKLQKIFVYPPGATKPDPKLTISGIFSPQGLAFDFAGFLYVANSRAHDVTVYNKSSRLIRRLEGFPDGGGFCPRSVAVDIDTRVYATCFRGDKPPVVLVFDPGATKPTKTMPAPGLPFSNAPIAVGLNRDVP
jgi:DNA-binding beta-propeller fold protein YncE